MLSVLLAACGTGGSTGTGGASTPSTVATASLEGATESAVATQSAAPTESPGAESHGPTEAASVDSSASPGGSAIASMSPECQKENLETATAGRLTVGTDNPAFPPWFGGDPPEDGSWEVSDPHSGEGYESAVAYAIAEQLGFSEDEVEWTYVPFDNSYAPGEKDFDFDINQISYTPERAESVDFSDSYYDVNQAVVAVADTDIAAASTISDLKPFKLGAPIGTTSYRYIVDNVQPDQEPMVYNTLSDGITALNGGQIDGLVVDLPTAFFVTAAEMENGTIVGQFPTVGEQEYFGVVLEKDSPLTECINEAIAVLRADGSLDEFHEEWLDEGAPVIGEG
ncbi:MAG: amino acid ABC transporter substrate-binding protein [Chloroflexi bacterium]|nr:amino acid ABC transporter substrate-binding protein [Chloroflexota bacterium]